VSDILGLDRLTEYVVELTMKPAINASVGQDKLHYLQCRRYFSLHWMHCSSWDLL